VTQPVLRHGKSDQLELDQTHVEQMMEDPETKSIQKLLAPSRSHWKSIAVPSFSSDRNMRPLLGAAESSSATEVSPVPRIFVSQLSSDKPAPALLFQRESASTIGRLTTCDWIRPPSDAQQLGLSSKTEALDPTSTERCLATLHPSSFLSFCKTYLAPRTLPCRSQRTPR